MHHSCSRSLLSSSHARSCASLLCGSLVILVLIVSLLSAFPAQAEAPFSVTLTPTNFGASFLRATPKNLSDPTHATFTLTNSSQMWYGLEVQALPSSLKLTAADLFENIKGADFAVLGLLPPSDFSDLLQHEPSQLDLAVSFSAPQQHLQVTLDPFDWKAAALDDLGIILQYLGLRNPAFKIGLLKSNVVKAVLAAVERSQELTELVNDTVSAGHALPDLRAVSDKLYKVAADLYNLFASVSGRKSLADILYLVVDDVVSKTSLSKVVQNFSLKTIVTAGQIVAFFLEYWSAFGTYLYRAGQLPTVLLQSVESTPSTTPQPVQPIGPITEFPVQGKGTFDITVGPDGNLWFTGGIGVGYITPAGQVTEFPLPTGVFGASSTAKGSDGNLWFIDNLGVGRVTPAGQVTEYPVPTANSMPQSITTGPDGNLWFTELNTNPAQIGRITTGGSITEFQLPPSGALPGQITAGPDGNLWFTDANGIGRFTPGGQFTEFPTHAPTALLTDQSITTGPDGNLWFTEYDLEDGFSQIGRITPAGRITMFPLSSDDTQAHAITAGPDGDLWFTEGFGNQIGRITQTGQFVEKPLPRLASDPGGIIAGPDGNIWFTEGTYPTIGRITP